MMRIHLLAGIGALVIFVAAIIGEITRRQSAPPKVPDFDPSQFYDDNDDEDDGPDGD